MPPSRQADDKGAKEQDPNAPTTLVNITDGFRLDVEWKKYLEDKKGKKGKVHVTIPNLADGWIEVTMIPSKTPDGEPKYKATKGKNFISATGITVFAPITAEGYEPVVVIDLSPDGAVSGHLNFAQGTKLAFPNASGLLSFIDKHKDKLGLLGIGNIQASITNTLEGGVLKVSANDLSVSVDGYLDASGSLGVANNQFTFDVTSNISLKGIVNGDFNVKRDESGKLNGSVTLAAEIAGAKGSVTVLYVDGAVTIKGSAGYETEKFSGTITIAFGDEATIKQLTSAEKGVEAPQEGGDAPGAAEKAGPKAKGSQKFAAWGDVEARFTSWLTGKGKIVIDEMGYVTLIGEIAPPAEVVLMEQKEKKVRIFYFQAEAGYGVPLLGTVGLFIGVGMDFIASFGPLVLKNISVKGKYSTDPAVMQEFSITGSLNINAFAALRLFAQAGIKLTLLGHDVKAGVEVGAAAGVKAYAEATPTFEYKETPGAGGKVGEAWLKGHLEAAAQLFLQLNGSFFVEVDAPWWSPVSDDRWDYPIGEVQYPLGKSLGIGGDVAWKVGDPNMPELKMSPVEFDPDKFSQDIMADPPKGKKGDSEAKQAAKWEDNSPKKEDKKDPALSPDSPKPEKKKEPTKEEIAKLSPEERFVRAMKVVGDYADAHREKPVTQKNLEKKLAEIKNKYKLDELKIGKLKGEKASVVGRQGKAKQDDLQVPIMSSLQMELMFMGAKKELDKLQKSKGDKEGTITQANAAGVKDELAKTIKDLEGLEVVDGGATWDYEVEIGGEHRRIKGMPKSELKPKEEKEAKDKKKGDKKDGDKKKTEPPTDDKKATDQKKKPDHPKMAKEAIAKLKAMVKKGKFESVYDEALVESQKLETIYNAQLKDGVKMTFIFLDKTKDKSDNDIDFKVKIAPNDTVMSGALDTEAADEVGMIDLHDNKWWTLLSKETYGVKHPKKVEFDDGTRVPTKLFNAFNEASGKSNYRKDDGIIDKLIADASKSKTALVATYSALKKGEKKEKKAFIGHLKAFLISFGKLYDLVSEGASDDTKEAMKILNGVSSLTSDDFKALKEKLDKLKFITYKEIKDPVAHGWDLTFAYEVMLEGEPIKKIQIKNLSPPHTGEEDTINSTIAKGKSSPDPDIVKAADRAKELYDELRKISPPADGDTILDDIAKKADELQEMLIKIIGVAGLGSYPTPKLTFKGAGLGRSGTAEMDFLSPNRAPGSAPEVISPLVVGWDFIQKKIDDGFGNLVSLTSGGGQWVQMHLINDNFGGLGTPLNLVPGTNQNNKDHLHNYEEKVKDMVGAKAGKAAEPGKDNVAWVSAKVQYLANAALGPGKTDFDPKYNVPTIDNEMAQKYMFASSITYDYGFYDVGDKPGAGVDFTKAKRKPSISKNPLPISPPNWSLITKPEIRTADKSDVKRVLGITKDSIEDKTLDVIWEKWKDNRGSIDDDKKISGVFSVILAAHPAHTATISIIRALFQAKAASFAY